MLRVRLARSFNRAHSTQLHVQEHLRQMSAIVKTKLKAARDAILKKDWEKAKTASSDVLDYEPDHYNA